jgi:hypothetical protein
MSFRLVTFRALFEAFFKLLPRFYIHDFNSPKRQGKGNLLKSLPKCKFGPHLGEPLKFQRRQNHDESIS